MLIPIIVTFFSVFRTPHAHIKRYDFDPHNTLNTVSKFYIKRMITLCIRIVKEKVKSKREFYKIKRNFIFSHCRDNKSSNDKNAQDIYKTTDNNAETDKKPESKISKKKLQMTHTMLMTHIHEKQLNTNTIIHMLI